MKKLFFTLSSCLILFGNLPAAEPVKLSNMGLPELLKNHELKLAKELEALRAEIYELVRRPHHIAPYSRDLSYGFVGMGASITSFTSFIATITGSKIREDFTFLAGLGAFMIAIGGFTRWYTRDRELLAWDQTFSTRQTETQEYAFLANSSLAQAFEKFAEANELPNQEDKLRKIFDILGTYLKILSDDSTYLKPEVFEKMTTALKFKVLLKRAIYKATDLQLTRAAYRVATGQPGNLEELNCGSALSLINTHWTKIPEWKFSE